MCIYCAVHNNAKTLKRKGALYQKHFISLDKFNPLVFNLKKVHHGNVVACLRRFSAACPWF